MLWGVIWALANANRMAYSFERNIFWNPGSLSTSLHVFDRVAHSRACYVANAIAIRWHE